ncbi:PatB family C-S lyase [Candidatus Albibeggiatoa sp. nov. NOAA]|uniref:MalY/PatB family protein n=1 Tax=Candidatus Albibeggiatoa sp. nov. NOAA TaxID=3162724 RepID=UPI0032F326BD|nr:PatB family C-S lyase [Thiotrichaceae bacterium]
MNNFDQAVERRDTDSIKWNHYESDVLPLWIADMDFQSPQPVIDALQTRVSEGHYGYGHDNQELIELICERMQRLYQWTVHPDDVISLPGLVGGFNVACRAIGEQGDAVLVQTPVYPPFLTAPANQQRRLNVSELVLQTKDGFLDYSIDFDDFTQKIQDNSRLFILCHPHNPIGRGFSQAELTQMADICLQNNTVICSDEIHCDLILEGKHQPFASLSPEIAQQTISLFAPSKTYNIAGLGYSFAIIQNPQLKRLYKQTMSGIMPYANTLSVIASLAAYKYCDDWLQDLIVYLRENRDFAINYIQQKLPQIKTTNPTATYLLWLDCRELALDNPHKFLLNQAKIALSDGKTFGQAGDGFMRLNFGCSRQVLAESLDRLYHALQN